MDQDIKIKAYKKYHRKRWYEFRHYIFNFEYRITGVSVDQLNYNSKITFDIEIRNITCYSGDDTNTNPGHHEKVFRMYIDEALGRPKKRMVRSFNFKIRHSSGLENTFVNMTLGYGFVPPSILIENVFQIGKIKYK